MSEKRKVTTPVGRLDIVLEAAPGLARDEQPVSGGVLARHTVDARRAGEDRLLPGLAIREREVPRMLGARLVERAARALDRAFALLAEREAGPVDTELRLCAVRGQLPRIVGLCDRAVHEP